MWRDTPVDPESMLGPLRDSLAQYRWMLGSDATAQIRVDAEELRAEAGYAYMSEDDLRETISGLDSFAEFSDGRRRSGDDLHAWWEDHALRSAVVVAAEAELIHRAQLSHSERAAREVERRGEGSADPISIIRDVRGDWLSDQVERRATVLAGALHGRTQENIRELSRAARAEIQRSGGLVTASPESLARASALQFERNRHNEQVARAQALEARTGVPGRAQSAEHVRDAGGMEF